MARTCGLSHFAIQVTDLERSIAFYKRYGELEVVKRYEHDTVWLSDRLRPFQLVLLLVDKVAPLVAPTHIGIICSSTERVDELAGMAREEGILTHEPIDENDSGGYWATISDPDGNNVEISHHQMAFYEPQWTPYVEL